MMVFSIIQKRRSDSLYLSAPESLSKSTKLAKMTGCFLENFVAFPDLSVFGICWRAGVDSPPSFRKFKLELPPSQDAIVTTRDLPFHF